MKSTNKKNFMVKQVRVTTKNNDLPQISSFKNRLFWILISLSTILFIFLNLCFSMFKIFSLLMNIVGVCVLGILFKNTTQGIHFLKTLIDSNLEIRKIVWPSRSETLNSTMIVIGVVMFSSVIVHCIGLSVFYIIKVILLK